MFVNQYQTAPTNPLGSGIGNGTVTYGSSSNSYWFYRPALGAQIDARTYGNTVYNITAGPQGTIPNTPSAPLLFAVDQYDQELIFSTLPNTLGTASYPTPANYYSYAIGIIQIPWARFCGQYQVHDPEPIPCCLTKTT